MTNLFLVTVTAYCCCGKCCGRWADGVTASGRRPVEGRTVAANWLPLGTRVRIEGFNEPKVVEDRMSKRFNDRLDIYFKRNKDAKRFGKKRLKVEVEE